MLSLGFSDHKRCAFDKQWNYYEPLCLFVFYSLFISHEEFLPIAVSETEPGRNYDYYKNLKSCKS